MNRKLLIVVVVLLVLASLLTACDSGSTPCPTAVPCAECAACPEVTPCPTCPTVPTGGGRLQIVKDRGKVICGTNGSLPGFSYLDPATNEYSGLDADYCRAIAAAVLGDSKAVEYRALSTKER